MDSIELTIQHFSLKQKLLLGLLAFYMIILIVILSLALFSVLLPGLLSALFFMLLALLPSVVILIASASPKNPFWRHWLFGLGIIVLSFTLAILLPFVVQFSLGFLSGAAWVSSWSTVVAALSTQLSALLSQGFSVSLITAAMGGVSSTILTVLLSLFFILLGIALVSAIGLVIYSIRFKYSLGKIKNIEEKKELPLDLRVDNIKNTLSRLKGGILFFSSRWQGNDEKKQEGDGEWVEQKFPEPVNKLYRYVKKELDEIEKKSDEIKRKLEEIISIEEQKVNLDEEDGELEQESGSKLQDKIKEEEVSYLEKKLDLLEQYLQEVIDLEDSLSYLEKFKEDEALMSFDKDKEYEKFCDGMKTKLLDLKALKEPVDDGSTSSVDLDANDADDTEKNRLNWLSDFKDGMDELKELKEKSWVSLLSKLKTIISNLKSKKIFGVTSEKIERFDRKLEVYILGVEKKEKIVYENFFKLVKEIVNLESSEPELLRKKKEAWPTDFINHKKYADKLDGEWKDDPDSPKSIYIKEYKNFVTEIEKLIPVLSKETDEEKVKKQLVELDKLEKKYFGAWLDQIERYITQYGDNNLGYKKRLSSLRDTLETGAELSIDQYKEVFKLIDDIMEKEYQRRKKQRLVKSHHTKSQSLGPLLHFHFLFKFYFPNFLEAA